MDETELKHRASQALQLQKNQILEEAFFSVKEGLIHAMETVPMTDHDQQQAITLGLQVLSRIQRHIQACIDDQKIHEFELQQMKQMS